MARIRGRKPSVAQRKVIDKHVTDPEEWLILKIQHVIQPKTASKSETKQEKWDLIHREDGSIMTITLNFVSNRKGKVYANPV